MGVEMTPGQETNDLLDSPLHLALGAPLLVPAPVLESQKARFKSPPHRPPRLLPNRTLRNCTACLPTPSLKPRPLRSLLTN